MEKYAVYQASDIHIRCSKSYGNNKADVLHFTEQLMKYIREQGHLNSSTVILLLGDIFDKSTNHLTHTGTIVSTFKQMLYLMQPCTVLIIPGNHDIPRDNSADDIIAACLKHVEYKHVLYCKSRGLVYTLDDSIRFYHHPVVIPGVDDCIVDLDEQYFNIGLFHEQVLEKSTTVSDSNTVRSIVQLHENYDLYLVGDAHNKWSMLDDRLVYSGAPIQHRMGECIDKYFVHWTIEKSEDDWLYSRKYIPLTLKSLFVHLPNINTGDIDSILDSIDELIDRHADEEYSIKAIKLEFSADTDVDDIAVRNAIIEEYRVKPTINIVTEEDIIAVQSNEQYVEDVWQIVLNSIADDERLLQYHSEVQSRLESSTNSRSKGKRWQLLDMKWSNVGCYGADNYVDFRRMKGMIHLRGKNSSGKSTFIDILLMALYGTAGGSMSTDTILNNIYSKGNYSIQLRIYTPDDSCTYTVERYGTRKTMKHRLIVQYADKTSKTVEGARNIDMHLSTILSSIDGSSSYSLLTSTCIALQDRSLNVSDIRFNVVEDLDRVIDELTKELNSNTNRVQMPDIPTVSKDDLEADSIDKCIVLTEQYETELVQLRGLLSESSKYNDGTISKYSQYSDVDIEQADSTIAVLRQSLYPDTDTVQSTSTSTDTLEELVQEIESLNLGTTLTDKTESELQSIVEEYDSKNSRDISTEDIPIALRSSPYSNEEVVQLPSTTVLEYTPIHTKYYPTISIDSIGTELDSIRTVLESNTSILKEYEEYCSVNGIAVPTKVCERSEQRGDRRSVECKRPELKPDLVRVEYRSKPIVTVDSTEDIDSLYAEVVQYEEYCSVNGIAVPTSSRECKRPELKDGLIRVEYRSKPSTIRKEYTADTLSRLEIDREQYSRLLEEYEEYCSVNGIPVLSSTVIGTGSNKPELRQDLVRVEYRNKPKYRYSTVPDDIENRIEQLEELISKSCRVDPTLLCTECKNRVECMSDSDYEKTVQRLEKYRHVLEYKLWLQYDEYSKYTASISQYVQYLRQKIKSIDAEISTVQQYLQWREYYEYSTYTERVGQYTAYIRSRYNAAVQYRDWLQYEEYSSYVSSVGQYTAYIRSVVKEYEDRVRELISRQSNWYYEQCHDYYWHINRRRILNSEIDKYRHDLAVIRDKRRKKQLDYRVGVLKYRHNCTVRDKIQSLEMQREGRLSYDKCLHNSTVLKEIAAIEQRLYALNEWLLYYRKVQEYDEWNRLHTIKRRYLTVLEEVRDSRLEYCRSTVENVCNEMLHNIYGTSKRIVISRDTDSKRVSNKYRVILEDNGRVVRRMAHSIKFIVDVLIRCALIRFNSNLPNFMIIDEGFGALDVENAVQFWSELKQEMSRYLEYTIVIDHGVVHDDDLVNTMSISTDITGSILQYPTK
jgi:DNA repair exonuclease SbcCD nuclease subunit/DNA repair exonuclease SbcCD ATPase subunit